MELRQDDITEPAVCAKDEDRPYCREILLVPLLARHVPHPADITSSIDNQDPLRREAHPSITEGLGQGVGRQQHREQEHDRRKTERAHGSSLARWADRQRMRRFRDALDSGGATLILMKLKR